MLNTNPIDMNSSEFSDLSKSQAFYDRFRNDIGRRVLFETQLFEPIVVNYEATPQQLAQILSHIQQVWTKLGAEEPHWSVVSTSDFKASNITNSIESFKKTGQSEAYNLRRLLARLNLVLPSSPVALEYGCGVGRVTRWLTEFCAHVYGVDVSKNHLLLAEKYLKDELRDNFSFIHVNNFGDIDALPNFDLLYSKIVPQHNPPPVIAKILEILLMKLNTGGIGVVQIPTYAKGYRFDPAEYIRTMSSLDKMEMHVLPQPAIFEIMRRNSCHPHEVFRDHLVTTMDFISTTFVFKKG